MRYVRARWKEHEREQIYRIYVTDCLRAMTESTAKFSGGTYIQKRFAAVVGYEKTDTRTGEEIAAEVIKKAGLVVISK